MLNTATYFARLPGTSAVEAIVVTIRAVLVDFQYFGIGDQRNRERITARQISSKH